MAAHPTAEWLARQLSDAFPWGSAPRYLVHDRDRSHGEPFKQRLRAMGIRDRPIAPRCPRQNACAERAIGSTRRECVGHLIVFNEAHLRRVLAAYLNYYNRVRTHLSLAKGTSHSRPVQRIGEVTRVPHLGGLHQAFVRIS